MKKQDIGEIRADALLALESIVNVAELEQWRIRYIGRKGVVPLLLRGIKDVPVEDRKTSGSLANDLRGELEDSYAACKAQLKNKQRESRDDTRAHAHEFVALADSPGHLHPITLAIRRIQSIFSAMGFSLVEGPEVEETKYDFDYLNIPPEHPARAEGDTFYIIEPGIKNRESRNGQSSLVLRTSTSAVQVRAVLEHHLVPPLKIFSPGRVFRNEKSDPSHESTFHQTEGLSIGQEVTISDFKATIRQFASAFFGKDVSMRLRPGYFPFVEPGFEVDMQCAFCNGAGCRVCKHTGWLEMCGAGMVHPNVLANMDIDPATYQGFAFGFGIERLVMLRHGIDDIRLFWSGDIRFLKQFS